ncbi:GNAT family N-acetyltransferase [Bacillus spongiae]|uniref:GNAT family N-acetyltransferase n=1 Tax=Bacillus spongiae TaxID=2683610 RepID=A0ABU8HH38_9BACI
MTTLILKEVQELDEMKAIYPLLTQLRTTLTEREFVLQTKTMIEEGYRMLVLYKETHPVAMAGVIMLTNYYDGKHVYVYDLVTEPSQRSKGYGNRVLQEVDKWGSMRGCEKVVLSSGVKREEAHRFYEEKGGFQKESYVFRKKV